MKYPTFSKIYSTIIWYNVENCTVEPG